MSALGPEMRELLDAVALGTATPEEVREAEAMARANPAIARELKELRDVVGGLGSQVAEHDAPPQLKDAVMEEVRADVAARAPTPAGSARRWWELRVWPVAAAAASVIAILLFAWSITLLNSDDGVATITVEASELPGASATVSVLDDDTIVVTTRRFPEVSVGSGYEVWLLGADEPVSAGFLSDRPDTRALAVAADPDEVEAIAITLEPLSNNEAPTTPILLRAELPS